MSKEILLTAIEKSGEKLDAIGSNNKIVGVSTAAAASGLTIAVGAEAPVWVIAMFATEAALDLSVMAKNLLKPNNTEIA